jgi:protein tyrosine/serine phosphatase
MLNNFGWVDALVLDGKTANLFRCAQPDTLGFQTLEALGVKVVVKLNDTKEFPDTLERELYHGEISFLDLPRLFEVPPKDKLTGIVELIHDYLAQGKSVLVHCTHGIDRTGLVIGAYRIIHQNWSMDEVLAERKAYGVTLLHDLADRNIVNLLWSL